MTQSMHASVVARLQEAKGTWPAIAKATSVPLRTLQKIASGEIRDPAVSNIERLHAYFLERAAA